MEPTLDQKIQEAIKPLVDRISVLQSENVQFKKDIQALQAVTQAKSAIKPPPKPLDNHIDKPTTAKGTKRYSEHQQVKPFGKPGPKKQEIKQQQQDSKTENGKAGGSKPVAGKPTPSPHLNKDLNNTKPRPSTGAGSRVGTGVPSNRSGNNDKKKTLETEHEKKEQGVEKVEEKKQHSKSKQKDQKPISVPSMKSPAPAKKAVQKKAPIPSPAPVKKPPATKSEPKNTPPPIRGGKHAPPKSKEKEEQKKEKIENTLQQEPIPDHVKIEMNNQTKKAEGIPDQVKQESLDLNAVNNNPYTPQEEEEIALKREPIHPEDTKEVLQQPTQPVEQEEKPQETKPEQKKEEEVKPEQVKQEQAHHEQEQTF